MEYEPPMELPVINIDELNIQKVPPNDIPTISQQVTSLINSWPLDKQSEILKIGVDYIKSKLAVTSASLLLGPEITSQMDTILIDNTHNSDDLISVLVKEYLNLEQANKPKSYKFSFHGDPRPSIAIGKPIGIPFVLPPCYSEATLELELKSLYNIAYDTNRKFSDFVNKNNYKEFEKLIYSNIRVVMQYCRSTFYHFFSNSFSTRDIEKKFNVIFSKNDLTYLLLDDQYDSRDGIWFQTLHNLKYASNI